MSLDFEKEMHGVAALIEPEIELAPETLPIAIGAVQEVDQHYGPKSDNPHPFHDAPHSIGGARRAVRLVNILYPFIPPAYQDHIYDLAIVGEAVHDRYRDRGPSNEADSGQFGVQKIEEADGALNTSFTKQRLLHGVKATTVSIEAGGRIVQPNMRRGARDPFKLVMGFSDKNGIAMEGAKRMWSDASKLYYEITPADEQTIEDFTAFCSSGQRQFLRQGLNDFVIKGDIAFHFPETSEEVYKAMYVAFHDNIEEAHEMAKQSERPEIQRAIGHIAGRIGDFRAGPLVGRMIRRKTFRGPTD